MGWFSSSETVEHKVPSFGGGPLGLGDPDDRTLRKAERDIVVAKMLREEATKRCDDKLQGFLNCAKENGILVIFSCRDAKKELDSCIKSWADNQEFVDSITDKYLYARSYYRRTGEPLEKYKRVKVERSGLC